MRRALARILVFTTMLAVTAACAQNPEEAPADPQTTNAPGAKPSAGKAASSQVPKTQIEIPRDTRREDWLPSQVRLTCALPSCPSAVGVILFAAPTTDRLYDVWRCTATLIDKDKILTNGHCDRLQNAEGYFVTRTDMPEKTFRRVSKLLFKSYAPPADKDSDELSGRPDVAVYQLESAIPAAIPPLPLARGGGSPASYQTLTAIVANSVPGQDALTMAIGRIVCRMHRHERDFPFELGENPDVLTAFDCAGEKGNSGSPMFAENSSAIEAVMEGSRDLTRTEKKIREAEGRGLLPYEMKRSIEATNWRCVDYPRAPSEGACLKATDVEKRKRFSASVDAAVEALKRRSPPEPSSAYETGFKAMRFELKTPVAAAGVDFEMLYYPSCRTVSTVKTVTIPSEFVRVRFDEWAKPVTSSVKTALSPAKLISQDADAARVEVNWAPAMGVHLLPEKDPRVQLGKTFSIALPPCAG